MSKVRRAPDGGIVVNCLSAAGLPARCPMAERFRLGARVEPLPLLRAARRVPVMTMLGLATMADIYTD